MSVCNVIRDLMPLYTDSAISADSRRAVREHLKTCPDCRAYFRALRAERGRRMPAAVCVVSPDSEYLLLEGRIKAREKRRKTIGASLLAASLLLHFTALAVHLHTKR